MADREASWKQLPEFTSVVENLMGDACRVDETGRINLDFDCRPARDLARIVGRQSTATVPSEPPRYSQIYERTSTPKLNIVVQIVGSRGDVQPFVALGNELQKHGHRVRIATHQVFDGLIRNAGLEFYPIGGDPTELMAYMVRNPGLIPSMRTLRGGEIQQKRQMVAEMLEGCWRSCIQPDTVTGAPFVADAIIANPPGFAHIHCAQALGIPVHLMFTMPWSSTRAFPHPLVNLKSSITNAKMVNFVSYSLVDILTWQGLGDVINKWRVHTLDLEPVPITEGPFLAQTLKIPFTYCWSPALLPKPTDWPTYVDVCGFLFHDAPVYTPSAELEMFLKAGPPPVYFGFGNMAIDNPAWMNAVILEAVQALGVRAIISYGSSSLGQNSAPSANVLYIGDCPHEWLFQHVTAVVHHGEASTTACGLRSGKPTTIVPFFGDQLFWGRMVAAAGAGPQPIAYKSLNARNLADGLSYCLTAEASGVATGIAEKMKTESGVKAAVAAFHANLPRDLQCDFCADQPAVWEYKGRKMVMRLSKLASQTLANSGRIEQKSLRMLETNPITIRNRRWDPLTASTSAGISTATNITNSTIDLVREPYKKFNERRSNRTPQHGSALSMDGAQSDSRPGCMSTAGYSRVSSLYTLPSERSKSFDSDFTEGSLIPSNLTVRTAKDGFITAGMMFGAFMFSIVKVAHNTAKGALIDIPFATTEGMLAVPKSHGDWRHEGEVTDWKSGFAMAGKTFGFGMYEGLTDIFVQPYRGVRDEGALGAAIGFGKGLESIATKTTAGTMALVAYPGRGIYKSLRDAVKSRARRSTREARLAEAEWLMRTEVGRSIDCEGINAAFDAMKDRRLRRT